MLIAKPLPEEFKNFRQQLRRCAHVIFNWSQALNCCKELCVAAEKIISNDP